MRIPGLRLPTAVAIIVGAGLFVGMPLFDYDYFWHHKTGEWIVTHGWTLPKGEPFSFTVAGAPWIVQGWMFDALQYVIHRSFGEAGVRAMFAALVVACWAIVYASVRLYVASEAKALILTMLCASSASAFLAPRPLAATNLAFALVVFALLRYRASGQASWLLVLPPVFALWINVHFAYVTGLAMVALFAFEAFLQRWFPLAGASVTQGRFSAGRLALALIASIGALMLNPYGWDAMLETFRMTRVNASTDIVDWLSPDFRTFSGQLFLVPLALLFIARALATHRPQWIDILVPLSVIAAALHSQRNIPLACIALAPFIARAFATWEPHTMGNALPASWTRHWRSSGGKQLGDAQYPLNFCIAIVGVVTALLSQPQVSAWQGQRMLRGLPVAAADFVIRHQLEGPMIHDYHTGGYLMYRLHPRVPVFVDGRYNPFVEKVLGDHDLAIEARTGWETVLDRYGIKLAILTLPHDRLVPAMLASGRYRLVHAEGLYGVLIRNDGSRPDLPAVPTPATGK